jgi:hypothetical protein
MSRLFVAVRPLAVALAAMTLLGCASEQPTPRAVTQGDAPAAPGAPASPETPTADNPPPVDNASLEEASLEDASLEDANLADKKKKRARKVPVVTPVTHKGVRYEALHWGKERELGQNGGYVVAFDVQSDHELWLQKIYDVDYDDEKESDKQDVFISKLALDAAGEQLLITNERDKRFRMRLSDRKVLMGDDEVP